MSQINESELAIRFTYHPPKPGRPESYTAIREAAHDLAIMIDDLCPDSREKALLQPKLEEAFSVPPLSFLCGDCRGDLRTRSRRNQGAFRGI